MKLWYIYLVTPTVDQRADFARKVLQQHFHCFVLTYKEQQSQQITGSFYLEAGKQDLKGKENLSDRMRHVCNPRLKQEDHQEFKAHMDHIVRSYLKTNPTKTRELGKLAHCVQWSVLPI